MLKLYPGALLTAVLFSTHGFRKGSLNASGALAAFAVGYLSLANGLKFFGILLLTFYFAGSRATKVKADVKGKLEEGHAPKKAGAKSQLAGNRNATQVLCNSAVGTMAGLLYRYTYGDLSAQPKVPPACLLESEDTRKYLSLATFFFAACMGDTLASELGMLATSGPRMVISGKAVPAGTNGGVTWWGTTMSLAGGAFVGLISLLDLAIETQGGLCLESSPRHAVSLLALATFSGGLGSALDSLVGALCQQTLYSDREKKVVKTASPRDPGIRSIGGADFLTNDQVNFLASTIVALGMVQVDKWLLS